MLGMFSDFQNVADDSAKTTTWCDTMNMMSSTTTTSTNNMKFTNFGAYEAMNDLNLDPGLMSQLNFLEKTAMEPVIEVPEPVLKNVVASACLNCEIDLKKVALSARNAEYNPKRFPAVIMRLREPKTTALIYKSGKMICMGARTVENARLAMRKFGKILKHLGFEVRFTDFKVVNMLASVDVKFPIRLEGINNSDHRLFCYFEPELFPALVYRVADPKCVALIFACGRVIITGAKSMEDINKAFGNLFTVIYDFKKKEKK